jgi:HK97 family phage prohead protease
MQWQPIDEFRKQPDAEAGLLKTLDVEVKADDASRELTFRISTGTADRVNDTIATAGWEIAAYQKNPVMLWAHDYTSLPVAKATRIWADPSALHATAEFTPAGLVRFNDIVFDLYKGGWLNAVSVGFRPLEWEFTNDKNRPGGIDFIKQELLEFSAVPVPANPDALIEARAAGLDQGELRKWALGVLRALPRPATIREFEAFLRDVGMPQKEAKEIASHGFKCLQREVEAEPAPTPQEPVEDVVLVALQSHAVRVSLNFH